MPAPASSDIPRRDDLAALVQQNQVWVWRYLRFLGCDPSLADDLTQETFVAVLGRERSIDPKALRSYLRRVASNQFKKTRSRHRRQVELVDETIAEVAFDLFCGRDDGGEYTTALRSCLASLDDRSREAIEWRYAKRRSRAEIGAHLDLAETGVKSLLQRTAARLRECIKRRMPR